MDQSHRHDALGQTTSPVISSMRAASAVISVFPSVPSPQKCIDTSKIPAVIDQNRCLHCGRCVETCPKQVIKKRCSHESK